MPKNQLSLRTRKDSSDLPLETITPTPRLRRGSRRPIEGKKSEPLLRAAEFLQDQYALFNDRRKNPVSRFPEAGQAGAFTVQPTSNPRLRRKSKVAVVPVPVPIVKPSLVLSSNNNNLRAGDYTTAPIVRTLIPPTTEKPGLGETSRPVVYSNGTSRPDTFHETVLIPPVTGPHVMSKAGRAAMSSVRTARKGMRSVSVPTSKGVRMNLSNKPSVTGSGKGLVIHHKEFLGTVVTSASTNTFRCDSYILNPGKYATFPWLSTLASNFEKYRIRQCSVTFVSNQPTTVAGRVGMGIDYDSTDPKPSDRQEFFSLTHHRECSVWDSVVFNIPIQGGERFINSHTTTDSKLIDAGQILIMSDQYATASTNVGDLIMEYVVELIDPQQAIYTTMGLCGNSPANVSALTVSGPVVGTMIPTTSTTVMELTLPTGYYNISTWVHDETANTPTCTLAVRNGSGTTGGVGNTADQFRDTLVKTTTNDATVRFTFSESVALMENIVITVSRISATLYNTTSFVQTTSLGTY